MINSNYLVARENLRARILPLIKNKNDIIPKYQGNSIDMKQGDSTSKDVDIGGIHHISPLVKYDVYNNLSQLFRRYIAKTYKSVDNIGINIYDPRARDIDIALAKYAQKVAEEINTTSGCYTGFKHSLLASGVLKDYGEMPKGEANIATEYFDSHPEKFTKLLVAPEQIRHLPAGHIIIYKHRGLAGHAAITTGYAQGMSDCTDNMKWLEWKGLKDSTVCVYKLSDGWRFNPDTKKLEFQS